MKVLGVSAPDGRPSVFVVANATATSSASTDAYSVRRNVGIVFFLLDFLADIFDIDLKASILRRQIADVLERDGKARTRKPAILCPLLLNF